jgi:Mg2+/Co2+ transporter CorB
MAFKWAHDDPKFQRTLQKVAAQSPETGVLNESIAAEEIWAKKNAARNFRLMRIGNELKNRERSFQINMDYKRGQLSQSKSALRHGKRQATAGNILSLLGVGVSGLMTHRANKRNLAQTRRTNRILDKIESKG